MTIINALPYNLTNGTTADASQVMADFNEIVNDVNTNVPTAIATAVSGAAAIAQQVLICTATQTYTNNTVLANIPGLSATVTSGKTYVVRAHIMGLSGAGGINVVVGGSLSATSILGNCNIYTNSGIIVADSGQFNNLGNVALSSSSNITDIYVDFTVVVNNGGTLVLQGAQRASNAASTTILALSNMIVMLQ